MVQSGTSIGVAVEIIQIYQFLTRHPEQVPAVPLIVGTVVGQASPGKTGSR
jgi:hypothetical protein